MLIEVQVNRLFVIAIFCNTRFLQIILLVYDITNMESFTSLNVWLKKVNEIMNRYSEEEAPTIAVMGNKCRYLG